jgi:SOS-response transcriptional repressor LexA
LGDLTKRQIEVLKAIDNYIQENHYAPAYRELGKIIGVRSSSTISDFLHKLKDKGYVDWEEGQPRTLHIIEKKESSVV